ELAWLSARAVKCANAGCGAQMPLAKSFALSTKPGKEMSLTPIIDHTNRTVTFAVTNGTPTVDAPKLSRGAKFKCLVCDIAVDEAHIKAEGMAKRLGAQLLAVVAEGDRSRVYLSASRAQADLALALD